MKSKAATVADLLAAATRLHMDGRIAEAEKLYDDVLKLDAVNADALNLKGVIRLDRGQAAEAIAFFDRAIAALPRFPELYFNKGNALSKLGHNEEALTAYAQAVALKPDFANARLNAALLLEKIGKLEDAIAAFRSMALVCPNDPRGHRNLAVCLEKLIAKKTLKPAPLIAEAFAAFERALALAPQEASTHCALGTLHSRLGRHAEAIVHTEKAIALDPRWADAWVNLGSHREALGDRRGALAAFDQALSLDPTNAGADVNRGLALLGLGDLESGWLGYARRFEDPRFPFIRREWPWPNWKGENLAGRSILLWGDQGIGDEVLYSGMIREVAKQARTCTVECAARLETLYRRSFPDIEIVARTKESQRTLAQRPFDLHCSVLDVGRWLRPKMSAFPNHAAVLVPDAARATALRRKYRTDRRDTILVGLSWRSANPAFGSAKSTTLDAFGPLLRNPKFTLVNVQYGDTNDEIRAAEGAYGTAILRDPEINALKDLDGLSAQLAALDLVVSVSNTTAHLAAALGVPTWLYVPNGQKRLWYWFDPGHYSPWYRSVWICRDSFSEALAALSVALAPPGP